MSQFLSVSFGLLPCLAGAAFWQWRRRRQAETRATRVEAALAERGRQLDLFAQELHGLGLTLMGEAGREQRLERQARALLGLAADVHDTAGAQSGPRVLKEERIALGPVLQEAIEQVSLALAPGRRQWCVAPELRQASLLADPRALRGALRQVLTRAVRHSRDGDPIALQLVRSDETIAIVVEDEGAGLPAEDLSMLGRHSGTRGLGLGLLVARQLLHAHEGELTIEAVQGIGARTWMTLPRHRLLAAEPA
ncbi:sensor histidine kinase KdpD [Pseudoroseomonas cervicalis]|uniref:sensor histidine kinase n=1 Tax=Teichococcus cervicalis TaxID=204525 RepID=UPI002787216B|nr:ATP-binding protein [Pseudoroseomonas cervicalis]MDQ1080193.1 signal transduction histidine kinase [Pseudoroseomonas cervicalis]